jgi:hypothetical protein
LLKDEDGNPTLQAIGAEDLQAETRGAKNKRRIVFDEDDDDESPF